MPQPHGRDALGERDPLAAFDVTVTEEPTGLAPVAGKQIATLPPLDLVRADLPLSTATGQPRRAKLMVLAIVLLYAAAVLALVALARSWWVAIHVASFGHSSALVEWWRPRPGGWRSIVAVTLVALVGAVIAAAPAVAAFNAWNGHRWSRVAAWVAAGLGLLGILIGPWAWGVPVLTALGAALLWLPPVTRYFGHWGAFRAGTPLEQRAPEQVAYGPLPRYRWNPEES